jgi:hypothetical protein
MLLPKAVGISYFLNIAVINTGTTRVTIAQSLIILNTCKECDLMGWNFNILMPLG